jgi:hypothetical protein
MLVYHPRNDVFHCTFRLLSILSLIDKSDIEIPRLKIIDFYIVFPHLVKDISFPRIAAGSVKIKKQAQAFNIPYENLPSSRMLFSEMGDFQLRAIDILKAKNILEITSEGMIKKGDNFSSSIVSDLAKENSITSDDFYKQFIKIIMGCPLYGENGLKKRTGLMEYRYDAVTV